MEGVPLNKIFAVAAYVLELLDFVWFLIRIKKQGLKSKDLFTKSLIAKIVVIYLCVLVLPAICFFINLGLMGDIALCGCAVLGMEMSNKDLLAEKESEE